MLSACETSIEQIKSGDDMLGFTRSLNFAGVGSILSPLWSVDAATYLMERFCDYLAQNQSVSRALQQAKLDTLKRTGDASYWVAFKLTGNP